MKPVTRDPDDLLEKLFEVGRRQLGADFVEDPQPFLSLFGIVNSPHGHRCQGAEQVKNP